MEPVENRIGHYTISGEFTEAIRRKKFILKYFSPLQFNSLSVDSRLYLIGAGNVIPTIPFFEDANIEFILDRNGFRIQKTFSSEELKLPKPFKVEGASLTIGLNQKGPFADGHIDFAIKNVGEGSVSAGIDSAGNIYLNGDFDIASDLFEESKIGFEYRRNSDGTSNYVIGGRLVLGKNKVKNV